MNLWWYLFQSLVTFCWCQCPVKAQAQNLSLPYNVAPTYSELTFPYLTLLRVNRLNFRHPTYCTGAAITAKYILTTTHCVWPLAYNIHAFNGFNLLSVGPGPASPETTSGPMAMMEKQDGSVQAPPAPPTAAPSAQGIFSIDYIKKHPRYIPPILTGLGQSDIALVRVKEGRLRTQLSEQGSKGPDIKLLAEGEQLEKDNEFFMTAGWHFGSDPGSPMGNSVHMLNVTLAPASVCSEAFRFFRNKTMLCFKPENDPKPLRGLANLGSDKLLGPCYFDVGAPVIRTFQGPYSNRTNTTSAELTYLDKSDNTTVYTRRVFSSFSGSERKDTIVGIISAVHQDCLLDAPFVATRVSVYADWAKRNSE